MGKLDGKTAIVTGAAQGLGEGIARRFADEGATTIIVDRADASDLADGLPLSSAGKKATAVVADVTDSAVAEMVIAETVGRHGRLDILVNNAGTYRVRNIIDETDESFQKQFAVNTYAVFAWSRAAGRGMRDQGWGRIISTSSQLGKVAREGYGIYSASKAAVILLTQALALELGPYGVTANAICPGTMATQLLSTADGRPGMEYAAELGVDLDTAFRDYVAERIPVGRLGVPGDIGALAAFLASDDGGFITGAALNLTGGEQVFF
ncbi:SDR family NAD(P)-dependent oxidoreductase [Amycolatopsis granulosa]|uniref:SDR family NAD(P)-dependent oxidoreductase n=1 Tax=Amycolatopsis granulosa TaxID=185684 RepID=UPI00141FF015|nr:SDR family oxidoreductase [Amycolatopsis granulosa]NIH87488.1 NAD(P)-dependent dehydrogenase (short-subunit alcohol dehydrogenase family) [Amycolatopsis granulosa]